jgi:UvrD-like helicase C-terminal domain
LGNSTWAPKRLFDVHNAIYRFKGHAAPCVIFTEVDFDTFDECIARKLFVGATRATMKLIVVASQCAYAIANRAAGSLRRA